MKFIDKMASLKSDIIKTLPIVAGGTGSQLSNKDKSYLGESTAVGGALAAGSYGLTKGFDNLLGLNKKAFDSYDYDKEYNKSIYEKNAEAKSKSQQRLMGMAYAYKKGELDTSDISESLLKKIKEISNSMSTKKLKEYAETNHKKNMPEKKANVKNDYAKVLRYLSKRLNQRAEEIKPETVLGQIKKTLKENPEARKEVLKATGFGAGAGTAAGVAGGLVSNQTEKKAHLVFNRIKGDKYRNGEKMWFVPPEKDKYRNLSKMWYPKYC